MSIEFTCVNCQARYAVSDDLAGRAVKCRECGARCRVPEALPVDEPQRAATPAPRAAAPAASEDPPHFRAAVGAAQNIYQMVTFLVSVGVVGCVILVVIGLVTGRVVEVFVAVVLAGAQMYFAVAGSMLLASLTKVLVGIGRDIRVVRQRTGAQ